MSDEIEQTDEVPGAAEPQLEAEVEESPAEEPVPTDGEPALGASDESELDTIVESLSDDDDALPEDSGEADIPDEIEPVDADGEADEPVDADSVEAEEPATATAEDAVVSSELVPEKLPSPVPWWPFWLLAFTWVALCGAAAYFLTRDPSMPSLRQDAYTFVVAGGLALTVLGPILAIVVWAFARGAVPAERRPGMFVTALLRAAVITFLGVLAWSGTLIVVDALRLGLIRF